MPFPKDTMVEVKNDQTPWYGQVESYAGGFYEVRIGGTNMTVTVAEPSVQKHPVLVAAEKIRQDQLARKIGNTPVGQQPLKMIETGADLIGSMVSNHLPDTIINNPGHGTILTLCNVNALLTLMWSSSSHVIVVDNDDAKIKSLEALLGFAESSPTMLDWYCKIHEVYGRKLLDYWLPRHRPRYQDFLSLKQCRSRVHIITQDLCAPDAIEKISLACHCECVQKITTMYVSNIEFYVDPTSIFCKDKEALARYKKNILSLMLENTVLIRGTSVVMEVHKGKAAVEGVWNK